MNFDRSKPSDNSNKAPPATPKVSKVSKPVTKSASESPSPLQNSRLSVEKSPRSVNSKPAVERKSAKATATPPDVSHNRLYLVYSLSLIFSFVCLYCQIDAFEVFSFTSIPIFETKRLNFLTSRVY